MLENVKEAKETLKDAFNDNEDIKFAIENNCIDDTIRELADTEVYIYYDMLREWLSDDSDNIGYIEDAVNEFGCPEPFDFYKIIQYGQLKYNEELLYEALEELKTDLGIEEV